MADREPKPAATVPLKMKIGYGLGDLGANFLFQPVMLFLMYFFTDVFMLGASTAGLIFLAAKAWDGISDPIIGFLSDRTRSRWGQKRPYLLFGALPLGLSFFLLFAAPDLTPAGRAAYALAAFLLFCTAYTVVNIPYAALTANLTLDSHERSRVTAFRMFFAIFGTLIAAGATRPVVGLFASEAAGWRTVSLVYGLLAAALTLVTFFSVRERVFQVEDFGDRLRDLPRIIGRNRPFLLLSLGMLMQLTAISILAAMINYFFKYNLARESFIPVAFLCLFVPAALALPFWVWLSRKQNKGTVFNLGMGLVALTMVVLYFIDEFQPLPIGLLLVLAGVGLSTIYLSPWSMVPDTVEYLEWKTGLRREGLIYGFFCFVQKLGAALGGFVSGQGLALAGYVPNAVQTPDALLGIRLLTTLAPVLLVIAGIAFIRFYPIDERLHQRMIRDIQRKIAGRDGHA
ncbi:MAG: MFS transporter [Proteobacteria bacterium]|nr:MFS transporter [Pseudomonadota bacterium]